MDLKQECWCLRQAENEGRPGVSPRDWSSENSSTVNGDTENSSTVNGDTENSSTADGRKVPISERQQYVLEQQADVIKELKSEGIRVVRLQAAVVAVAVTAVSIFGRQVGVSQLIPDAGAELTAVGIGVFGVLVLLAVFVLIPRPFTDSDVWVEQVVPIEPSGVFRFPSTDGDVEECIEWNQLVIACTEHRIQRLQQFNIVGLLFVALGAGLFVVENFG